MQSRKSHFSFSFCLRGINSTSSEKLFSHQTVTCLAGVCTIILGDDLQLSGRNAAFIRHGERKRTWWDSINLLPDGCSIFLRNFNPVKLRVEFRLSLPSPWRNLSYEIANYIIKSSNKEFMFHYRELRNIFLILIGFRYKLFTLSPQNRYVPQLCIVPDIDV